MSQKKVDEYKKAKANRKKEVKRARINKVLTKIALVLCSIAIIGYIGWSVYDEIKDKQKADESPSISISQEELASMFATTAASDTDATDANGEESTDADAETEADDSEEETDDETKADDSEEETDDKTKADDSEEETTEAE